MRHAADTHSLVFCTKLLVSGSLVCSSAVDWLSLLQDKQGNTPLHVAASHRQTAVLKLLLQSSAAGSSEDAQSSRAALTMTANRAGLLPIHAAAIASCLDCCSLCYTAASEGAQDDMLAVKDKKGLTAAAWALKQGNKVNTDTIFAPVMNVPAYHLTPCCSCVRWPPSSQFAASISCICWQVMWCCISITPQCSFHESTYSSTWHPICAHSQQACCFWATNAYLTQPLFVIASVPAGIGRALDSCTSEGPSYSAKHYCKHRRADYTPGFNLRSQAHSHHSP